MTNSPTPSPEAEALPTLPVVAWQGSEGAHTFISDVAKNANSAALWSRIYSIPLTPHAPAEATIVALRAEVEQWKAVIWALARELNCLPSSFSDGNDHVLKAAIKLNAEVAELRNDAERLDWLDREKWAYGFADVHEGNRWEIEGPFKNVRAAIDTARAALLGDGGRV